MITTAQRIALLKHAWRNPSLRRLCVATGGFRLAELGTWVALIAYAYTAGGVGEASAVTVAQLVPATLFALTVGGLIRRWGPTQVLRWGLAVQSAGMLLAAVFLRVGNHPAAFVAAVVAATTITTTRPAQSVITPGIVDGPDQLTAANVLSGALLAAAGLAGPAIAAVLMSAVGSWAVFAVMSVVVSASAAAVWRLPAVNTGSDDDPQSLIAGVRATAREPGPRVMVLALSACFIVIGALDVLAVVVAVELLGEPEAYSGYLTTAAGAGGLTAGMLALALIGRRWIAPWIVISALAAGVALVGVSIAGARIVPSMVGFVIFGVAAATYELTALMLLQRVARLDLVGHVFTIVEALQMAMLAVGAAIVPLAVHLVGSHWAPAAVGALFALLVGALTTRIVLIDRHARVPITEMAALRAIPLLGALPGPALETIAKEARRVAVPAGEVLVRQGEPGHDYFAVINGEVIVSIDGVDANRLGRGQGFGEIALLRDVPRTATVRAATDATLLALGRDAFLTALTGHMPTHERATSIASGYAGPG